MKRYLETLNCYSKRHFADYSSVCFHLRLYHFRIRYWIFNSTSSLFFLLHLTRLPTQSIDFWRSTVSNCFLCVSILSHHFQIRFRHFTDLIFGYALLAIILVYWLRFENYWFHLCFGSYHANSYCYDLEKGNEMLSSGPISTFTWVYFGYLEIIIKTLKLLILALRHFRRLATQQVHFTLSFVFCQISCRCTRNLASTAEFFLTFMLSSLHTGYTSTFS
jgi:hypothetical protein